MALAQTEASVPDVFAEIPDKGDCPAMAQAIRQLHQLRRQDNFPTQDLAKVILKDPGLSTKVLRVVNSAFFRTRGDPITTISRAVVLLGIDTIVDLASGILLVEQLDQNDPDLHLSLMESLRAALLAQTLAELANLPNPEEAYLLGLFANLGRLWLAAHYRGELTRAVESCGDDPGSVEDAIQRHFGFSPDLLSAQILEQWGLPPKYSNFFRRHVKQGARAAVEDKLVLVAELSTETDDAEFVRKTEDRLGLSADRSRQVLASALDALNDHAEALGIGAAPPNPPGRKRARTGASSTPAGVPDAGARSEVVPTASTPTDAVAADRRSPDAGLGMQVAAGIARSIVDRENLALILRDVLDGLARSGGFDAVVLYFVDRERGLLTARLCNGDAIAPYLDGLSVPLTPDGGLAARTSLDATPHVVEVASPGLLVPAGATPPEIPARSMVTHPLVVRERPIGVLVAMRGRAPSVTKSSLPVVQLFSQLAALAIDDRASAS